MSATATRPTLERPPTPGLDTFAGTVLDAVAVQPNTVTGRRIALIGEPRRVVRAVPCLAGHASTVKVFQTDGVWVLPAFGALDARIDAIARFVPPALRWRVAAAVATCNLRRGVRDGWTRRHLAPQVAPGTATTVRSSGYYRSLRSGDVELIVWPIAGVVPAGIRTADGIEHHVDIIVVA